MDEASIAYYRERERVEREAANNAKCITARLAHEGLAAGYAALIRDARKRERGKLTGFWSNAEVGAIRRHSGGPY